MTKFLHPRYFDDSWNRLDFFIVLTQYLGMLPGVSNITSLRALRVLRPLKTLHIISGLKVCLFAFFHFIPLWYVFTGMFRIQGDITMWFVSFLSCSGSCADVFGLYAGALQRPVACFFFPSHLFDSGHAGKNSLSHDQTESVDPPNTFATALVWGTPLPMRTSEHAGDDRWHRGRRVEDTHTHTHTHTLSLSLSLFPPLPSSSCCSDSFRLGRASHHVFCFSACAFCHYVGDDWMEPLAASCTSVKPGYPSQVSVPFPCLSRNCCLVLSCSLCLVYVSYRFDSWLSRRFVYPSALLGPSRGGLSGL